MRTVQVHFPSGKEVLGRYWGLLRGGGLRLLRGDLVKPLLDGEPGEIVRLVLTVQTLKKSWQLVVQVVDLERDAHAVPSAAPADGTHVPHGALRMTLAFLPEESPDEMLDAVWADGFNVPQRRTRRMHVESPVHFTRLESGAAHNGTLVNLSLGGCCIAGRELPLPGAQVAVHIPAALGPGSDLDGAEVALFGPTEPLTLAGRVRWTERPEDGLMGVEFVEPDARLSPLLSAIAIQAAQRSTQTPR